MTFIANTYTKVNVVKVPEHVPDWDVGAYATWKIERIEMDIDLSRVNIRSKIVRVVNERTYIVTYEGTSTEDRNEEVSARLSRYENPTKLEEKGEVAVRNKEGVDRADGGAARRGK